MPQFEFERKLDPLALIALIVALANVFYTFIIFARGADLELISPEQVLIRAEESRSGRKLALFSTRLSCLNRGKPGYPGVIQRATLSTNLGSRSVEHQWQDFGYAQVEGGELKLQKNEDSHPVGIEGGGLISKEVFFYPRTNSSGGDNNFLGWSEFLDLLSRVDHLDFHLTIHVLDGPRQTEVCRVKVTNPLRKRLKEGGWSAPSCTQVKQSQAVGSIPGGIPQR